MLVLPLLAATAHAYPDPLPTQEVAWPSDGALVPRDVAVHVLDPATGGQGEPVFTDADGAPVPHTTHTWDTVQGDRWLMLVPDAELAPGDYRVMAGDDTVDFVVEDRLAAPAGPPSPYRRWRGWDCPMVGEHLEYRVCGGGVVHLVATGDERPPDPTPQMSGNALVASVGEDIIRVPLDEGWPGTVWVGDLDEAGRFGGWWSGDEVEPPLPGTRVSEAPAGADVTIGATATEVTTCPEPAEWEVYEQAVVCDAGDDESSGCGCGTTGPPAAWGLALLAGVLGVRRSARRV